MNNQYSINEVFNKFFYFIYVASIGKTWIITIVAHSEEELANGPFNGPVKGGCLTSFGSFYKFRFWNKEMT